MATQPKELKLVIPALNKQSMKVKIVGITPLIWNQFPMKAINYMMNKQMGKLTPKKREARDPEAEYLESFYRTTEGYIAMPALNIKQAIVDSARNIQGVTMTTLKGSIWIVGDTRDGLIPVLVNGERVKVTKKPVLLPEAQQPPIGSIGHDPECKDVTMRRDVVRLAGIDKPADLRFRGQADNWSMEFLIQFNADVIEPAWILNLLNISGSSCGIGEWRIERNGQNGAFEVAVD